MDKLELKITLFSVAALPFQWPKHCLAHALTIYTYDATYIDEIGGTFILKKVVGLYRIMVIYNTS